MSNISTTAGHYCTYVVRFRNDGDSYVMIEAHVNRNLEHYTETSYKRDAEMSSYLVDVLLLHQRAVFPSDDPSSEKQALLKWSQVGRAMFGQHPKISRLPSIAPSGSRIQIIQFKKKVA